MLFNSYDFFKNIDHLNAYGAAKFAERFAEDIRELGLI